VSLKRRVWLTTLANFMIVNSLGAICPELLIIIEQAAQASRLAGQGLLGLAGQGLLGLAGQGLLGLAGRGPRVGGLEA
jgi:hypothetical protein